jgi:hypothetical protein
VRRAEIIDNEGQWYLGDKNCIKPTPQYNYLNKNQVKNDKDMRLTPAQDIILQEKTSETCMGRGVPKCRSLHTWNDRKSNTWQMFEWHLRQSISSRLEQKNDGRDSLHHFSVLIIFAISVTSRWSVGSPRAAPKRKKKECWVPEMLHHVFHGRTLFCCNCNRCIEKPEHQRWITPERIAEHLRADVVGIHISYVDVCYLISSLISSCRQWI